MLNTKVGEGVPHGRVTRTGFRRMAHRRFRIIQKMTRETELRFHERCVLVIERGIKRINPRPSFVNLLLVFHGKIVVQIVSPLQ